MPRPLLSKIKSQMSFRRSPPSESKLVKLIVKQKWDEVLGFLADHGSTALGDDKHRVSIHSMHKYGSGVDAVKQGNILHIMCEYHPPYRVVHRVASLFPLLVIQLNAQHQTPLHVAAAHGASSRVIATRLQKGGSASALIQDSKGRTPLHAHIKCCTPEIRNCDPGDSNNNANDKISNSCHSTGTASTASSRSSITSKQGSHNGCRAVNASSLEYGPNIHVLRLLAEAAPQTIHMVDQDGKSPNTLATTIDEDQQSTHSRTSSILEAGAPLVSALQKTAAIASRRMSLTATHTVTGNGRSTRNLMGNNASEGGGMRRVSLDMDKMSSSCHGFTPASFNRRNSMTKLSGKIAATVRRRSSQLVSEQSEDEECDQGDGMTEQEDMDDIAEMTPSSFSSRTLMTQPSESERDLRFNPSLMNIY